MKGNKGKSKMVKKNGLQVKTYPKKNMKKGK